MYILSNISTGWTYKNSFVLRHTSTSRRRTMDPESGGYRSFEIGTDGNLLTDIQNGPIILSKWTNRVDLIKFEKRKGFSHAILLKNVFYTNIFCFYRFTQTYK